jgi:prepilin-type N-terminal cleavage/methylation domain-containing protein
MRNRNTAAFSLVEILVVIAVIGIAAALLIPQIRNVRGASETAIARQQQAELQVALGNWIAAASSGPGGLAAARGAYSGDKQTLIDPYLHPSTAELLEWNGNTVKSDALIGAGATLQFSAWGSNNPPVVEWKSP